MGLTCCISGKFLNDTHEERAVQRLAKWLLSLGYKKEQIQVHPQYLIKRKSDSKKRSLPVDLALFKSAERSEANLLLIAECKAPGTYEGLDQLRGYLQRSGAKVGIWFDGTDMTYVVNIPNAWDDEVEPELPSQGSNPEFASVFGSYLRLSRTARATEDSREFSLRSVAKKAAISPAYLSRLEKGDSGPPSDAVIESLAKVLDCDENVLMAKAGKIPRKLFELVLTHPREMSVITEAIHASPDMAAETVLERLLEKVRRVRDGDW